MSRRLRLVTPPRRAQREDYALAAAEVDARLRKLPGLVAIYALGSVSAPGISDLDRVAVVERRAKLPAFWERLSDGTRYAAMHSPFAVDTETFRRRDWFAHLEPLTLMWGETTDPEPSPEGANLVIAAESLVLNLLRAVKAVHIARVKVRAMLCELHSVRHGLRLAGLQDHEAPEAWALAREVADLRAGWFEIEQRVRERRLRAAVAGTPAALRDALAALGRRLGPDGGVPLRLGGAWSNVTLVPEPRERPRSGSHPPHVLRAPQRPLLDMPGRRLGEARWRARTRTVAVSGSVLALLAGAYDPDFHAERDALVRDYARWAAARAPGYSTIGVATTFLSS